MSSVVNPSGAESTSDLIIAGGGAAGFFAAITCAETCPGTRILLLEKSREVLGKVKISGGGRCNVTNATFDPRELCKAYPRGARQLIGPFHHWGPADTMSWFEDQGVPLKTEPDGRVFPVSDDSQTIIDCLTRTARDLGITVRTSAALERATFDNDHHFTLTLNSGETLHTRHLLLTTGGTRTPIGADIAAHFGHRIEPAAPSLFTFKIIDDSRLTDLPGLSVPSAAVVATAFNLKTRGPVLITHWGLSGPAILRLSAEGAREFQNADYRFEITIHWCSDHSTESVTARLDEFRQTSPRKTILADPQFTLPARLWKRLAEHAGIASDLRWAHLPRDTARFLTEQLTRSRFHVDGKSMNKEEFVTCGGVALGGVDFKTMESRHQPGLYFAGEILDIDGITGGFNFQSAWTTAYIAGLSVGC